MQKQGNTAWLSHFRPLPLLILTATRRAFGSGFARPSALALRCCGASPYGPLRRASGQGCARPSALAPLCGIAAPCTGAGRLGRAAPPARRSARLALAFARLRRLRYARRLRVAGRPSRPARRFASPGLRPWPSRGIGPRLRLGPAQRRPLPYCESVPLGRVRAAPVARGKQPPRLYSPLRARPQGSIRPAFGGAARPCPLARARALLLRGRVPPGLLFSVVGPAGRFVPGSSARGGLVGAGRAAPGPAPLCCFRPPRARCGGVWFAAAAGFARAPLRAARARLCAFPLKGGSYTRHAPSRRVFFAAVDKRQPGRISRPGCAVSYDA